MTDPRELNRQFVENALNKVGLGDSDAHKSYAASRLAAGAIEYGEFQFRDADCSAESAEEGIDGANWAGFEWVKRWEADTLDEGCEHLTRAAMHFALAYEELSRYKATRPDESTTT